MKHINLLNELRLVCSATDERGAMVYAEGNGFVVQETSVQFMHAIDI